MLNVLLLDFIIDLKAKLNNHLLNLRRRQTRVKSALSNAQSK